MTLRFSSTSVLALLCFGMHQHFNGQTLTCQTNCPQAGDIFSMRTSSPVLGASGINQLWNFANVSALNPATHQITYSAASTVPSSSVYPQASICRTGTYPTAFLYSDNSGMRQANANGYAGGPDAMILPLPFKYGDSFSETITTTSVSSGNTVVASSQLTISAVGTGTLILPSGTYPDVLMIKYKNTLSSTTNGTPDSYILYNTSYYYYSPAYRSYLVYFRQLYETGQTDYGPYTEIFDHVGPATNIDEQITDASFVKISPNPTSDLAYITAPGFENGICVLRNELGQEVLKQHIENSDFNIVTENLPQGIYFITLSNGSSSINKKLLVTH